MTPLLFLYKKTPLPTEITKYHINNGCIKIHHKNNVLPHKIGKIQSKFSSRSTLPFTHKTNETNAMLRPSTILPRNGNCYAELMIWKFTHLCCSKVQKLTRNVYKICLPNKNGVSKTNLWFQDGQNGVLSVWMKDYKWNRNAIVDVRQKYGYGSACQRLVIFFLDYTY